MNYLEELQQEVTGFYWCYFIVGPLLADGILFSRLRRYPHFAWRLALLLLLYLPAMIFLSPLVYQWSRVMTWVLSFVLLTGLSALCFRHSIFDLVFCTTVGAAIANSINLVFELFTTFVPIAMPYRALAFIPWDLACVALAYVLVAKRIRKNADILMSNYLVFFLAITLLFCTTGLLNDLPQTTAGEIVGVFFFRLALNITIILTMLAYRKTKVLMDEQEVLEGMIAKGNEQFAQTQAYLETIDIKCHDFRQLLNQQEFQEGANVEVVSELAQSVEDYRNMPKTGNRALDAVLFDKIIVCRQKDISLTYMVDGHALSQLEPMDIATLFNNLLYNAMDYVSTLPEKEKRLISMNVYQRYDFLHIEVENYCETPVRLVDGLPLTSKKNNPSEHGYGLKSVRYTVEKKNGVMAINQDGHRFSVALVLPLQPSAALTPIEKK